MLTTCNTLCVNSLQKMWKENHTHLRLHQSDLNLNGLLVTRQIDNTSPGGAPGGKSLALTRDANLDTQSSDISAEEIRESGRSFQSLIVCGKKLLLYASLLAEGI